MKQATNVRNRWKRGGLAGTLALGLLFLPAASGTVMAKNDHGDRGRHYQSDRNHDGHGDWRGSQRGTRGYERGRVHYAPAPRYVRVAPPVVYRPVVRYYRPRVAPVFFTLPTAQLVLHGPNIAAQVVAYPAGGVPVYEPGYCPAGPHYHPYYPDEGVHGSLSIRIGF